MPSIVLVPVNFSLVLLVNVRMGDLMRLVSMAPLGLESFFSVLLHLEGREPFFECLCLAVLLGD